MIIFTNLSVEGKKAGRVETGGCKGVDVVMFQSAFRKVLDGILTRTIDALGCRSE